LAPEWHVLLSNLLRDEPNVVVLRGGDEQGFTDISFNNGATLLFAWAYGHHKDSLYVWRCEGASIIEKAEVESHYNKVGISAIITPVDRADKV
jgi:hypothetical protein